MRLLYFLFFGLVPCLAISQVTYNTESFETVGDIGIWNAGSGSDGVSQSTVQFYDGQRSIYLQGTYSYIITDALDLSQVTQVEITFYYRTSAGNNFKNGDAVVVESNVTGSWNREATFTTAQTSFVSTGTITIDPPSGSNTFSANTYFSIDLITGNKGPDFAYIDLVEIKVYQPNQPPSAPSDLTANNFTENSFDVSWGASSDPEGDAFTYNVYRDNSTNLVASGVSSTSYSFTSLTANTTYDVFVEAEDSNGNTSAQTTKSFTTNKAPSSIESNFNGGTLTVGAGTVFTTNNMVVNGTDIVINSNSSSSGMLKATGTVTTSSSNAFTYNRSIPDTDWYLISSPVENYGTSNYVSDNSLKENGIKRALGEYRPGNSSGNRWNYFNSTGSGSVNVESFDSSLVPAKGYATSLSSSGTLTFKGDFVTLTDGKVTISKSSPNNAHLWYAVGNPFMTYYPVSDFLNDNGSNFDSSFGGVYIWDGDQNDYVDYDANDNFLIAPGQGFLVRLNTNNNTPIVFNQSSQSTAGGVFYQNEDERPGIILYMSNQDRVAKTKLFYTSYGSKDLDPGYDLGAYKTLSFDIKSKLVSEDSRDINYNRQTLSEQSYENQIVPLSISSKTRQLVEFRVDHNKIPDHLEIYLEDKLAQQYYNLKENRAQIVVDAGSNSQGRFYLHTKPFEFWIEDKTEDDNQDDSVFDLADGIASKAFDFFNLKDNILHFEGVNSKEQVKVNLFNLNGNKVFSTREDLDTANNAIQLPYTLSEGVYIVELYRPSGKKITKKIIVR